MGITTDRPAASVIVRVVAIEVVAAAVVVVDELLVVQPPRVVARMANAINSVARVRRYFFIQTPYINKIDTNTKLLE